MSFQIIFAFSLIVLVAVTSGDIGWGGNGGHSNTYRKQDDWGNYAFGYDIVDGKGAKNSRHETGDGWGNKQGSYSLHDVDGRSRHVTYTADKSGFYATIKTNEPGTGNIDAAAAIYNGPDAYGQSHTHVTSGSHGGYEGGWDGEQKYGWH